MVVCDDGETPKQKLCTFPSGNKKYTPIHPYGCHLRGRTESDMTEAKQQQHRASMVSCLVIALVQKLSLEEAEVVYEAVNGLAVT